MKLKVLQTVPKGIKLDLVLCLGKNLNKDNSLDWVLQARVEKAIKVCQEHPEATLMFSGGKYFLSSDYSSSETKAMFAYTKSKYPSLSKNIVIEDKSDNTIDQLCKIKKSILSLENGEV